MLYSESTLKELMLGNYGPPAYMLDYWNYLDIIVLLSSYLNMLAVSSDDSPLAMLRILRAFRPLRIVSLEFTDFLARL